MYLYCKSLSTLVTAVCVRHQGTQLVCAFSEYTTMHLLSEHNDDDYNDTDGDKDDDDHTDDNCHHDEDD